jgi:hypothetical protein
LTGCIAAQLQRAGGREPRGIPGEYTFSRGGSTTFDVPANIQTGPSRLEVVTNGIASEAMSVVVAR